MENVNDYGDYGEPSRGRLAVSGRTPPVLGGNDGVPGRWLLCKPVPGAVVAWAAGRGCQDRGGRLHWAGMTGSYAETARNGPSWRFSGADEYLYSQRRKPFVGPVKREIHGIRVFPGSWAGDPAAVAAPGRPQIAPGSRQHIQVKPRPGSRPGHKKTGPTWGRLFVLCCFPGARGPVPGAALAQIFAAGAIVGQIQRGRFYFGYIEKRAAVGGGQIVACPKIRLSIGFYGCCPVYFVGVCAAC